MGASDVDRLVQYHRAVVEKRTESRCYVRFTADQLALLGPIQGAVLTAALKALDDFDAGSDQDRADVVTLEHLVDTIVAGVEWRTGPPDIRDYWARRREAIEKELGVHPPTETTELAQRVVYDFINDASNVLARGVSPFAGYYELPEGVGAVLDQHREAINELSEQLEQEMRRLIRNALVYCFPGVDQRSTDWESIAKHGVDRQPPRGLVEALLDGDWF